MNLDLASLHFDSINSKKTFIVHCAAEHFLKHGYEKTMIQDIIETYGNFTINDVYYHFTNKAGLAYAVLGYACEFYEANLFPIAKMVTLTKKQRALDFINKISELTFSGPDWLLLANNFHKLGSLKIDSLIKNHTKKWITIMSSLIEPTHPNDKTPTKIAEISFSLIIGAMLDNVYGSETKTFLKRTLKCLWLDREL